jgi:hypothetical protein
MGKKMNRTYRWYRAPVAIHEDDARMAAVVDEDTLAGPAHASIAPAADIVYQGRQKLLLDETLVPRRRMRQRRGEEKGTDVKIKLEGKVSPGALAH